jgi:hypothetical protein
MQAQDEFLTCDETARWLRTSRGRLAVQRCRKLDGPAFIKLQRKVLYRRADVLEWLESRRIDPGQPKEDIQRLDTGPQGRERKGRRTG